MPPLLRDIVERFLGIKLLTSIVSSLFSSLAVTLVIAVLLGLWIPKQEFPYVDFQSQTPVILFVVSLLCLTILFYVVMTKEADDILTPIRKRLVGHWSITYQSWRHELDGSLVEDVREGACTVGIDITTRKTYIEFRSKNNQDFQDLSIRIDDITINPKINPIRLTYFHEMTLNIQPDKLSEFGLTDPAVEAPIFVCLDLVESQSEIKDMKGKWYDLDARFAGLMCEKEKRQHPSSSPKLPPNKGWIQFTKLPEP